MDQDTSWKQKKDKIDNKERISISNHSEDQCDTYDNFCTDDEILRCDNNATLNESANISSLDNTLCSFTSTSFSSSRLLVNSNCLNLACANARSVVEKIDSVVTLFEENSLHLALLTETWLTAKACPARKMADLTTGANLSFIRRDRGSRGGGVAICYNPTKLRLTRFKINQVRDRTEIVCAVGNSSITKRKIGAISIYLPPSLKKEELAEAIQTLVDCVDQLMTKFPGAIVFVGGDFNKKDISVFLSAFPLFKPVDAGATRQGEKLDEIYSNIPDRLEEKLIQKPLCKNNGVESDHSIISATFKLPKHQKSTANTFSFRPITTEGVERFGRLIALYDWENFKQSSSSASATKLNEILQSFVLESFPMKTRTIRSTDAPG